MAAARIEHIALWTDDIDRCLQFYARWFGASPGMRYRNGAKGFESCFLGLAGGARIEVMRTTTLAPLRIEAGAQRMGLTHVALEVGDEAEVDRLAAGMRAAGVPLLDGPRRTGDGYYECVVLDPDGNRLELAASR